MRTRPTKNNPQPYLDAAVDPAPRPGWAPSGLRVDLIDAGVPMDAVPQVEAVCQDHAFRTAGEFLRRLLLSLGDSPAAVVLRRCLLGTEGQSLAADAKLAGTSKQALGKSEQRLAKRIRRLKGPVDVSPNR